MSLSQLPTLIGLLARKGAGKDTAAEVLLCRGYQNVKFAGPLKNMLRSLLAYQHVDAETIERMVEGDLKEEPTPYLAGKTPRFAMQRLGTEWGRDLIGGDFWASAGIACAGDLPTVITDVRFPNEVQAVELAGGIVIGIAADWIKPVQGEHESEALIDDLIAALPDNQRITNRRAAPGFEREAIQEFQRRFLHIFEPS